MKAKIKTRLPGPKSRVALETIKRLNLGWGMSYPFVQGKKGKGCYVEDIDGNVFLDFGSQICTNPLGYNHPDILSVLGKCGKFSPLKIAGQDFAIMEHAEMLEELLSICPRDMDSAMLVNSGAEAVENCMKVALRKRPGAKYGVSFESAFHGRTLGALSMTNSKSVQKKGYLAIPSKRLPYDECAGGKLLRLIEQEGGNGEIGFVIVEPVQGEGGYNIGGRKMLKDVRKITKTYGIPLICDEVQSGMGRTGEWWAHQHSGIVPDIMGSAKALGIGAAIANKKRFGVEPGGLSSTWGGGHFIDLAIGMQTIRSIKKRKLLLNVKRMGVFLRKRLDELQEAHGMLENVRGVGLMNAFDVGSANQRNSLILEMVKRGVVLLGTGRRGIRVVPPYIVGEKEIDEFIGKLSGALDMHIKNRVKHSGGICDYIECGSTHT